MTEKRKVIGRGLKVEAVRRVKELGETPIEVAQALGVRGDQVRQWMKQLGVAEREGGLAPGRESLTSREHEELKALRRENEQLRKEREFLKKAAAYFAKESPDGTP
jgi:transposase